MFFVSKAASVIATRAIPALTSVAIANPIAATVLTVGSVGLAAWKGSEVAVKSAPALRAFKEKVHSWSAPEAAEQDTDAAPEAVTMAEMKAFATAALKAAKKATEAAEEATRRLEAAAMPADGHATRPRKVNGAQAA